MATYNTAFGSLPGYNEMLGTTNTTGGGQQTVYGQPTQQRRQTQQPAQTFAQMQQQGMARPPAPTAPQAQSFAQYGGSEQGQQMRQQLQQQLAQFAQSPSRFDTQAFQQIRGAQAANLQAEYQGQQKALNEELARRGLSASSVGGGRMGDLAGQQARALSSLDAQLLQQAAETQAQDRAQLLAAGQGLAELAGSQDLQQFEANRVAQAATFENQLRQAQFGQQQYEQARQEAFQGAQAEEAAGQAARQFDLSALGQTANLSLDLQRLLGQQEVERAQLTGQLGGVQTLAGQQQAEQRRQFDIQQALQQQLGLGGLDVQRGQLGVEQQRLSEQARQFGLTLNEQQAQRLQQGGFTAQELALESQKVGNQASQFGQTLSAQERQNQALNNLEQQKLTDDRTFRSQQLGLDSRELDLRSTQIQNEFAQRGQQITNDEAYRRAELNLRTTQIQNEYTIAGRQIGVDEARTQAQKDINTADNAAQMNRLTSQLSSQEKVASMETALRRQLGMMEATGNIYNVGADGAVTQGTGSTLARLQQNLQQAQILSQITGKQYTVDNAGNIVQGGTQTEAARQFDLDALLRRQLGLTEASGYIYDANGNVLTRTSEQTVQGQIARSQTLLSLANALGNLTPEQISQLLGKASPTTTPPNSGGTPTPTPKTDNATDWSTSFGPTTWGGGSSGEKRIWGGKVWQFNGTSWIDTSAPPGGTTQPPGGTTQPPVPTTQPPGPTTAPPGGTTQPPGGTTPPPTTKPPTTTTTPPPIGAQLTDNERSIITSSLIGDAFEGRYQYNPNIGGWVTYTNGNWYKYSGAPPYKAIQWNGQTINVYPGYATYDYSQGGNIIWDGTKWVPISTSLA